MISRQVLFSRRDSIIDGSAIFANSYVLNDIMNYTLIAQQAGVSDKQARNTIALFEEGATVPFIARYRKEATGGLDEVQIGAVKEAWQKQQEVEKRREAILKSIEEQGKLTPELKKKIEGVFSMTELEDLYLPYKQKRKTPRDDRHRERTGTTCQAYFRREGTRSGRQSSQLPERPGGECRRRITGRPGYYRRVDQ